MLELSDSTTLATEIEGYRVVQEQLMDAVEQMKKDVTVVEKVSKLKAVF
jgi:hypothetical protein